VCTLVVRTILCNTFRSPFSNGTQAPSLTTTNVVDPDPDWTRIQWGPLDPDPDSQSGSRTGSRRAKMTHKNRRE
jgi:hypothetical protein